MISVIIPCYNSESYLHRAVDSVIAQTYTDWEIFLIDNNSTDRTLEVIQAYEKHFPGKIKALSETKKGAPAARNKGLQYAKGQWVQFLDSDDELLKTKFEDQLALVGNQDVDIISGAARIEGNAKGMPKSNRAIMETDPWLAIIGSNLGITSANLFNRSMLMKVSGWNEELKSSQEYEMMFRMLIAGAKVKFDDKPNTVIHMRESGISRSTDSERRISILDSRIKLRLSIQQYLKEHGLLNTERQNRINVYIYSSLKNDEHIVPQYVKEQLNLLQPNVPVFYKFKKNIQQFFLNLKGR